MPNDPRLDAFSKEADKVITFLHAEYAKLQTGRANAALLETVEVDAYGQRQQLKAVAGITVEDARTLSVQPWDPSIIQAVEKAITDADLGANPSSDGTRIRLSLPAMTEERRKDLVKVVHKLAEEARISIRQQRQSVHDDFNKEKDEDVKYTLQEQLQKAVDKANEQIEASMKEKEKEVMTV